MKFTFRSQGERFFLILFFIKQSKIQMQNIKTILFKFQLLIFNKKKILTHVMRSFGSKEMIFYERSGKLSFSTNKISFEFNIIYLKVHVVSRMSHHAREICFPLSQIRIKTIHQQTFTFM
jgi:hypothetical protein